MVAMNIERVGGREIKRERLDMVEGKRKVMEQQTD